MQENNTIRWALLILSLLILFILNISLGSVRIPLADLIAITFSQDSNNNRIWSDIIWNFRMPKALTCVLAGSGLAAAGLQMQTLFRNALAGPDVLGLSSGASLSVALIFMSHSAGILFHYESPWIISLAATAGCAAVLLVMLLVAGKLRDNVSLLIVGLMVGAATSSIVSVLQYLSKAEEMQVYIIWTFGSLGGLNWEEINVLTVVIFSGVAIAFSQLKSLNAWLLGDHYAQSLGVNMKLSRLMIIISASILTGAVTAFCGPIAFVGLAVPHLTRLVIRSHDHKVLIPAVLIAGAGLLLLCDIISQMPGSNYVLPINAITALIGAPVVIWIIMRNKVMRV
jgi:iron complex transport system permease protein